MLGPYYGLNHVPLKFMLRSYYIAQETMLLCGSLDNPPGGEIGGEWIQAMNGWVPFCPSETITTLLIGYTPIQNNCF